MIILVGNQKGGCGKSTISVNIAAFLAQHKQDVILVDTDTQMTASLWSADREKQSRLPKVYSIQKYENIHETLKDLNKRYDWVIVDAAGRDSRELRTGMTSADILLMPFRTSQPDLDTLPKMQELITQARDFNPSLKAYAFLTMVPTNHLTNEHQQSVACFEGHNAIKLLNSIVHDRKVYRDAMGEGCGVIEMDNQKAKQEITSLMKEVTDA